MPDGSVLNNRFSSVRLNEVTMKARENITEPRREKTNVLVSDQVRHKPGCTATEDG